MKRESLAYAFSGVCFGLLVGWILGSQQAGPVTPPPSAPAASSSRPGAAGPPPLDIERVAEYGRIAKAEPANALVRTELGNLYFDAERFDLAIPWYEAALKLDPKNVDVSTDLGVSYYYTNQADRALAQLDRSLAINPRHVKTLYNQGIVRALGKNDLLGAAEAWEKVVALAPESEEGRRAKQGLDGIRTGHSGGRTGGGSESNRPPEGAA